MQAESSFSSVQCHTRANAIQREKCKDEQNTKKDKKVIKLKNQNFRTPENQSPQKLEI